MFRGGAAAGFCVNAAFQNRALRPYRSGAWTRQVFMSDKQPRRRDLLRAPVHALIIGPLAWARTIDQVIGGLRPASDQNFARIRAPVICLARLSRQIIKPFEAMTTLAPISTVGNGQSFQISQPNNVAHTMPL